MLLYKHKKIVLLLYLFALSISAKTIETNDFNCYIFSNAEKNKCQIGFKISYWSKNLYGFNLKRREIDLKGKALTPWLKLNQKILSPTFSINEKRKFKNLGLKKKKIDELNKIKFYLEESKYSDSFVKPNKDIINLLQNDTTNDMINLFSPMYQNYNYILGTGMGFIDHNFKVFENKYYQYGVFFVNNKKEELSQKFSLHTPKIMSKKNTLLESNIIFTSRRPNIQFQWYLNEKKYQDLGLAGFYVYYVKKNGDIIKELTYGGPASFRIKAGLFYLLDYEGTIDVTKKQYFAVEPVDFFGRRYPKTIGFYDPTLFKPFKEIEIKSIEKKLDKIKITWEVPKEVADAKLITGFQIMMNGEKDKDGFSKKIFFEKLSPNRRSYFVNIKPKPGKEYVFMLYTYSHNIDEQKRSNFTRFKIKIDKTPRLAKNLRGKFFMKGEDPFIQLNWDPIAKDDPYTKTYRLSCDFINKDELLDDFSIGNFETNKAEFKFIREGGREYTFRLQGFGSGYEIGQYSSCKVYVPYYMLPPFKKRIIKPAKNFLQFHWKYVKNRDLVGFRIFINDKILVDEKTLKADTNTWIYKKSYKTGKRSKFYLIALFNDGRTYKTTIWFTMPDLEKK